MNNQVQRRVAANPPETSRLQPATLLFQIGPKWLQQACWRGSIANVLEYQLHLPVE
jgi:hypothetical protein